MYLDMTINSSSFAAVPFIPTKLTNSNSTVIQCYRSKVSILVFIASYIAFFLLLPVCILVLFLGYQQWKKQHSTSRAAVSHSDAFLHHSLAMELASFLAVTLSFCGGYLNFEEMRFLGLNVWYVTWLGQALFQFLTCVDRYLAVVKPITYRRLKQADCVRMKNMIIGCVWLLSFGWLSVFYRTVFSVQLILHFCVMTFFIISFSFCSISVLYALKRPGPGEVGGSRERVDQSKLKAWYTIMAIMGTLLFRIGGNLISTIIYNLRLLGPSENCVMYMCDIWFSVPSNLVLPLLFLHRTGKLQCYKKPTKSK